MGHHPKNLCHYKCLLNCVCFALVVDILLSNLYPMTTFSKFDDRRGAGTNGASPMTIVLKVEAVRSVKIPKRKYVMDVEADCSHDYAESIFQIDFELRSQYSRGFKFQVEVSRLHQVSS